MKKFQSMWDIHRIIVRHNFMIFRTEFSGESIQGCLCGIQEKSGFPPNYRHLTCKFPYRCEGFCVKRAPGFRAACLRTRKGRTGCGLMQKHRIWVEICKLNNLKQSHGCGLNDSKSDCKMAKIKFRFHGFHLRCKPKCRRLAINIQ